jgi:hypothetical protein
VSATTRKDSQAAEKEIALSAEREMLRKQKKEARAFEKKEEEKKKLNQKTVLEHSSIE